MSVTQDYKKRHSFTENLGAAVFGVLMIAAGPILAALGLLKG